MRSLEASVGFLHGSSTPTSIYTLPEGWDKVEMEYELWSVGSQILSWVSHTVTDTHILCTAYLPGPGWVASLQRLGTPWWSRGPLWNDPDPHVPSQQLSLGVGGHCLQKSTLPKATVLAGQNTPQYPPGHPKTCSCTYFI